MLLVLGGDRSIPSRQTKAVPGCTVQQDCHSLKSSVGSHGSLTPSVPSTPSHPMSLAHIFPSGFFCKRQPQLQQLTQCQLRSNCTAPSISVIVILGPEASHKNKSSVSFFCFHCYSYSTGRHSSSHKMGDRYKIEKEEPFGGQREASTLSLS